MIKEKNIQVNMEKLILSSEIKIFKTESFFYQTKKIIQIDRFILHIGQSIQNLILEKEILFNKSYIIETIDKRFCFEIYVSNEQDESEIVFTKFITEEEIQNGDTRILNFLSRIKIFNILLSECECFEGQSDLLKKYYISSSSYVNFPMLTKEQESLVEIENKNVLVQGVAGSGKTNICINKIIYTACRNYSGKVLYTTFSRGLLIDTKNKIDIFKNQIKNFILLYKTGKLVFLDRNHKKAIENYLGIFIVADNDENILNKLQKIVSYLEEKVDYFMIDDLALLEDKNKDLADESVFVDKFLKEMQNHQLKTRLEKISNISISVIYKEVYGMIQGFYNNNKKLSLDDYINLRSGSFSKTECEIIYMLSLEYQKYKKLQNLTDYNEISLNIINNQSYFAKYSISVIDEVQDFTQINLVMLKKLSLKVFAVGDALQMINPSYFSFAFLKKLLYDEDVTDVAELESNFRNNKKIVDLLQNLSVINKEQFGTHSFVLSAKSVDESNLANVVSCYDKNFIDEIISNKYDDYTIIVSDFAEKENLRKLLKKQEILTVSEVKGLERETVVLYNILSSNSDKWAALERNIVSHKLADENSIYRYYFNLFYVSLSRAKHNLFVFEENQVNLFDEFLKNNFDFLDGKMAFENFSKVVSKNNIDDEEMLERIDEFIKLGQFDNAKFYANKLSNDSLISRHSARIDIYKFFVFKNKNKEAGIKFWQIGFIEEAKKQFEISGDNQLIDFMDSLQSENHANLDYSIVKFFEDFSDNVEAQNLIVDVLKMELDSMKEIHNETKQKLHQFKENKNGK